MAKNKKSKVRFANSLTRSGKPFRSDLNNDPNTVISTDTAAMISIAAEPATTKPGAPLSGIADLIESPVSPLLASTSMNTQRWFDTNVSANFEANITPSQPGNEVVKIVIGSMESADVNENNNETDVNLSTASVVADVGLLSDVNTDVVPPSVSAISKPPTIGNNTQDVRENDTNKLLIQPTILAYAMNTAVTPSQANPKPPSQQSEMRSQHANKKHPPSKPMQPSQQSNVINKALYSSFFSSLPRCAGEYSPRIFKTSPENPSPPIEIVQEGVNVWKDHLVGFFLDSDVPFHDIREQVRNAWKLRGGLHVNYVNGMFYFKFSLSDDRSRVLESDPAIFGGKPFIVTPWSPTVERARERVVSIPVWTIFTRIPSVLQTLPGLNWLASRIGNFKCFDANTEARKNLVFAKAMIEITPTKPLPNKLKVSIDGYDTFVDVQYTWQPEICTNCQTFGHLFDACNRPANCPIQDRIPLQKPPPRVWACKPKIVPDFGTEVVSTDTPVSAILDVSVSDQSNITPCETERLDVDAQSKVQDVTTPHEEDISDLSDSSTEEDDGIYWQTDDTSWLHTNSGMRYDPKENMYYIYVSDLEDENRRLFYKVVGEDFVLMEDGEIGDWNRSLFHDSTWDWEHEFRSPNSCYVPNLAVLFLEYVNVIGTSSSSSCSSDEE